MSEEACYADDIGDYRWEGFPLEQKVAWIRNAPGASAVQPGVDALRGLGARYAGSHRTVQSELAKLGVSWRGQSAEAAGEAVTQLADWVSDAGQTVSGGEGSMGSYGASFEAMRPHINLPPPSVHPMPSLSPRQQPVNGAGVLAGFQSSIRQEADATAAADAQANAALRTHQQATRAALAAFPLVKPPPEVASGVVSTAPGGVGSTRTVPSPGGGLAAAHMGKGAAGRAGAGGGAGAAAGDSPAGAGSAPGSAAPGAGQHVADAGSSGGTTSAAAAPAPAPTADAGWTPLSPVSNGGGLVSGPNGGLVPASLPPPYRASPGMGSVRRYGGHSIGFGKQSFGMHGGRGEGYRQPPLAPRAGSGAVRPQYRGDFGVPQSAPGRGCGPAGAPIGMGGGGDRGDQECHHRNQTFIPSDEPFRVEFFDVTPPVLGVREGEAW